MPISLRRLARGPRAVWLRLSLLPISRQVRRERLTYLTPEKLHQLEAAVEAVTTKDVAGDFVEFGLALGGSGVILATRRGARSFHGFDVFAQIPPPTSVKDDRASQERYAVIERGESTGLGGDAYYGYMPDLHSRVVATFDRLGVPLGPKIQLHKGLFEDTWPAAAQAIDSIALAHIDCDWYDPVKFCLGAVESRMAPGGIIILDDYFDYSGCRAAVDEFLVDHPDFVVRHQRGNVSLVRKL